MRLAPRYTSLSVDFFTFFCPTLVVGDTVLAVNCGRQEFLSWVEKQVSIYNIHYNKVNVTKFIHILMRNFYKLSSCGTSHEQFSMYLHVKNHRRKTVIKMCILFMYKPVFAVSQKLEIFTGVSDFLLSRHK